MPKKYYHADNAGQPIAGVQFHVYEIVAGTACGVYATVDPKEIAALDKLVESRRIITSDAEEFDLCSKKNLASFKTWKPLAVNSLPTSNANLALKGTGVVTVGKAEVADESSQVVEINSKVETVDDALALSSTNSPDATATDVPVTKPANGKSKSKN